MCLPLSSRLNKEDYVPDLRGLFGGTGSTRRILGIYQLLYNKLYGAKHRNLLIYIFDVEIVLLCLCSVIQIELSIQ